MPESPAMTEEQVITMFVEQFAESFAVGNFDTALSFASLAGKRWLRLHEQGLRHRARAMHIPWPLPGDARADDVNGWDGWYGGGYGGALA